MTDRKQAAKAQVSNSAKAASELAALLARNDQFADALGDLLVTELDNPNEFARFMKDAKAYLQSRNVELPANARVKFAKNSPFEVCVCVDDYCVCITVVLAE